MTVRRGPVRFLISAASPMMPSKWKNRRWVEISDGSILPRAAPERLIDG
jgi:hypothetical protein